MGRSVNIIPNESIEISKRFFDAIEFLISRKEIRGLKTIADSWGIDRSTLSTMRNHPESKRVKVEYIQFLNRDYGISANWIITGKGDMTE